MKNKSLLTLFFIFILGGCRAQILDSNERLLLVEKKMLILEDSIVKEGLKHRQFQIETSDNIERLYNNDEMHNGLIATIQNMANQSSTDIANQLTVFGIGITLVIAIVTIVLTFIISTKEKSMIKILEKSDINLKKTEEYSDLVNSRLSTLYGRLKIEEYNDIVHQISSEPSRIKNHLSRLLTLDSPIGEFDQFCKMMTDWYSKDVRSENVHYMLVYLINKYPEKTAANNQISKILINKWPSVFHNVDFDKLTIFITTYVNEFLQMKYAGIDIELGSILKDLSKTYNGQYIANEELYDKYSDKKSRFKIFEMLINTNADGINLFYNRRMHEDYDNDHTNSVDEVNLLNSYPKQDTP